MNQMMTRSKVKYDTVAPSKQELESVTPMDIWSPPQEMNNDQHEKNTPGPKRQLTSLPIENRFFIKHSKTIWSIEV